MLRKFLRFVDANAPAEAVSIRALAKRFVDECSRTDVDPNDSIKMTAFLGTIRPGYVTARDAAKQIGKETMHDRLRHLQTADVMRRLGFERGNVVIGGVKTKIWLRGWTGSNLTRAIASGTFPDLLGPPKSMQVHEYPPAPPIPSVSFPPPPC
ncbi:hypothetical protein ACQR1I_36735 [Bradyrhizobium sp. HKCCYLS2038]|uniref:hypothetical protein n=1 Tax=Bradyrhizobium sp. HKCCYLS2038 TaxID=3420764 RepID=UPI003EB79CAD